MNDEKVKPSRGLQFDWADGPDDPPEPYTSVELQHLATEWRIEMALGYLKQSESEEEDISESQP